MTNDAQENPFLTWTLHVSRDDDETSKFVVKFQKPRRLDAHYLAEAHLSSRYFDEDLRVIGGDELQAFGCLFAPIRGIIERLIVAEGYAIFHTTPGDLERGNFWGFKMTVPKRKLT